MVLRLRGQNLTKMFPLFFLPSYLIAFFTGVGDLSSCSQRANSSFAHFSDVIAESMGLVFCPPVFHQAWQ